VEPRLNRGPAPVVVVDHFHLVQLANARVTDVRRRVTIQVRGRLKIQDKNLVLTYVNGSRPTK
jgi:transposase